MSVDLHRRAEELMIEADALVRHGDRTSAEPLYVQAGNHEAAAYDRVPANRPKTRGVLAVSAVSLLLDGGAFDQAIRQARHFLADPDIAEFARHQLEELLAESERQKQLLAAGKELSVAVGDEGRHYRRAVRPPQVDGQPLDAGDPRGVQRLS